MCVVYREIARWRTTTAYLDSCEIRICVSAIFEPKAEGRIGYKTTGLSLWSSSAIAPLWRMR